MISFFSVYCADHGGLYLLLQVLFARDSPPISSDISLALVIAKGFLVRTPMTIWQHTAGNQIKNPGDVTVGPLF